jgi:ubiquinone biosynthesis monooxygenase Coq7
MIRVDQAGEFGATRIYAGQLAIMGDRTPAARPIARMAAQEARHRQVFDAMIVDRRVRPTLLAPLWNMAGFALGAATAFIGPRAAMACTAAVETEIDAHYGHQQATLGNEEPALKAIIAEFQAEEVEHRETALREGAEGAPAYPLLFAAIRAGCRLAINATRRI